MKTEQKDSCNKSKQGKKSTLMSSACPGGEAKERERGHLHTEMTCDRHDGALGD